MKIQQVMSYDKNKFQILFGFIGGVIFYIWLINYLQL